MKFNGKRSAATLAATIAMITSVAPVQANASTVGDKGGYAAWFSNFPCLFTDPPVGTNEFSCIGSNDWAGSLNATTYFTGEGTYDAVTQASEGIFDERVILVDLDGRHGTIHLLHRFTIAPVSEGARALQLSSTAKVLGGTGGFKGASGVMDFSGLYSYLCCGAGILNGQWNAGADKPVKGSMSGHLSVPNDKGGRDVITVG